MVIIRFNQWGEFLEELKANSPEDRSVRLTFNVRYEGRRPPHLTIVAGYMNGSIIVEFIHYLGHQPLDPKSQRSVEIQRIFDERKKCIEDLGFTVMSGRYHVPSMLHPSKEVMNDE